MIDRIAHTPKRTNTTIPRSLSRGSFSFCALRRYKKQTFSSHKWYYMFPHTHIHLHCNKQCHRWLDHYIQAALTTNRSLLGLTTDFDAIFHVYNCHPITRNVFRGPFSLWPPSLSSLLLLATSTTCYHHPLAPYVGSISKAQRCFEIMPVFFGCIFLIVFFPSIDRGGKSVVLLPILPPMSQKLKSEKFLFAKKLLHQMSNSD